MTIKNFDSISVPLRLVFMLTKKTHERMLELLNPTGLNNRTTPDRLEPYVSSSYEGRTSNYEDIGAIIFDKISELMENNWSEVRVFDAKASVCTFYEKNDNVPELLSVGVTSISEPHAFCAGIIQNLENEAKPHSSTSWSGRDEDKPLSGMYGYYNDSKKAGLTIIIEDCLDHLLSSPFNYIAEEIINNDSGEHCIRFNILPLLEEAQKHAELNAAKVAYSKETELFYRTSGLRNIEKRTAETTT